MKITQERSYKPITITLETRAEADAFWSIVCDQLNPEARELKNKLSDWFTDTYQ